MLVKNFLSKTLNTVSVLTVSGVLLGTTFTTSGWAMEPELSQHPLTHIAERIEGGVTKELLNFRAASNLHKKCTDEFIQRSQSLRIAFPSKNSDIKYLDHLPFLALVAQLALRDGDDNDWKVIGNFTNLLRLSVESKNFTEEKIQVLASNLEHFSKLNSLTFFCSLGEKGGEAIGSSLRFLPNLQSIKIDGFMGPSGAEKFANGLSSAKLTKLHTLKFSGTEMGDQGSNAIADQIHKFTSLVMITIDHPNEYSTVPRAHFISKTARDYFKKKTDVPWMPTFVPYQATAK